MGKIKPIVRPGPASKPKPRKATAKPVALTLEQKARLDAFNRYINRWMGDDSGEQEETWNVLKKALDENRTSLRRHFRE